MGSGKLMGFFFYFFKQLADMLHTKQLIDKWENMRQINK